MATLTKMSEIFSKVRSQIFLTPMNPISQKITEDVLCQKDRVKLRLWPKRATVQTGAHQKGDQVYATD